MRTPRRKALKLMVAVGAEVEDEVGDEAGVVEEGVVKVVMILKIE
jgi:hypothetical protein